MWLFNYHHAYFLILIRLVAALGGKVLLHPIPCHSWLEPGHRTGGHGGHGKEGYTGSNLTDVDFELRGSEQLLWGSPNGLSPAPACFHVGGQRVAGFQHADRYI